MTAYSTDPQPPSRVPPSAAQSEFRQLRPSTGDPQAFPAVFHRPSTSSMGVIDNIQTLWRDGHESASLSERDPHGRECPPARDVSPAASCGPSRVPGPVGPIQTMRKPQARLCASSPRGNVCLRCVAPSCVRRPHRASKEDRAPQFRVRRSRNIRRYGGLLMKITRRFTEAGKSPYDTIEFRRATSEIKNPDGSVVFRLDGFDVPEHWSQVAADILAQKYFRKAGVARAPEEASRRRRSPPGCGAPCPTSGARRAPRAERYGGETDARQVFDRLAGTWTYWGWKGGYFTDRGGRARLLRRAPLHAGDADGARPTARSGSTPACTGPTASTAPARATSTSTTRPASSRSPTSAYEHPQPHACFIQSIEDDLVNEGGIMDLWVREARLFKYGSGTGSNFSRLRGDNEKLSGGGKSSGLMSFLKIGDRAAGAIKSGGTTRRAAKMVVVDVDHPDIEEYINWKVKEEQKVAALVTGSKICQKRLQGHHEGLRQLRGRGRRLLRSRQEPGLEARHQGGAPRRGAATTTSCASSSSPSRATRTSSSRPTTPTGTSEAYLTVSGQNSNNSVRVTDEFLNARRGRQGLGAHRAPPGKPTQDAEGARAVGPDRPRRLGLRRPRHPVPHHHQRLAHLPAERRRSAPPTRARSTCSSTTRPATSPRST